MAYAILDNDTITAHGAYRQLWPDVSFPRSGPNAEFLAEHGAVEIRHDPPHDPETHYLRAVEPYLLDGVVYDCEVVEQPPMPEPEPEARWQDFQIALLTDPLVHAMMMSVKDIYPGLISAWSVGLGQAATGGGHVSFATQWTLARQLVIPAGLPNAGDPLLAPETIARVAELAAANDLPADFVGMLTT